MNYKIINYCFFILICTTPLYAQFPSLKGSQSSGIISVVEGAGVNGYNVNYEVTKSKIGFNFINQKEVGLPVACREFIGVTWPRLKSSIFDVSLGLDDFTFNPLGDKSDPEFNFSYSFTEVNHKNCKTRKMKDGSEENHLLFSGFQVKPTFSITEKDLVRFGDEDQTYLVHSKPVNLSFGVNVSLFTYGDHRDHGADWAWSISAYAGYNINHTDDLKTTSVCQIIDSSAMLSGTNQVVSSCKDYLLGTPNNIFEGNLKFDVAKRIGKPFIGSSEKPRYQNPALYFIARTILEYKPNTEDELEFDIKVGLSFSRTDRQVYASTLISLVSIFESIRNNNETELDQSGRSIITIEFPFR